MSQKLRGFVGQSMSGQKKITPAYVATFPAGTFTWTCPRSGYYRFVNWGVGAVTNPGASGSHTQTVALITKGKTVTVVNGSVDATFTLPNGRVITAAGAVGNTPGVASGGDLNLNGSVAGAPGLGNNGGALAANYGGGPGNGDYRGGDGNVGGAGAAGSTNQMVGYAISIIARQFTSAL